MMNRRDFMRVVALGIDDLLADGEAPVCVCQDGAGEPVLVDMIEMVPGACIGDGKEHHA